MTLSGWQRLWVVLTLMWTLVVGVVTWSTWPPTYLSFDPRAGFPPQFMDGVLKKNETLTRAEFAARLKAKYPEYEDWSSEALVTQTLQTFPEYSSFIGPPDLDDNLRPIPLADDGFVPDSAEVTKALNRGNRNSAIRFALMLWLLPPVALYALGAGIGWVYRGFTRT